MAGGSAAAGIIAAAAKGAPGSISTSIPAVSAMIGMKDLVPGGSFIQPFISSVLPHFASGGDVLANRPSMVGERGLRCLFRILPAGSFQITSSAAEMSITIGTLTPGAPMIRRQSTRPSKGVDQAMAGSVHLQHQMHIRTPHGR